MITQDQYDRLCEDVQTIPNHPILGPMMRDVADLLESFEVLYAVLDGLCARNARPGLDAFEALTNDDGTARVELVCRGKGRT